VKESDVIQFPKPTINVTTCREAVKLSKAPGVRVFWRPGGVVNWMLPELDAAQILEG
jgi:hypothetical protein